MNVKKAFADRLRLLREKAGLSQTELGEKLGVSRGTISFYESEKRTADIEFLAAAASLFDVSPNWLLGISDGRSTDKYETYGDILKGLAELNDYYAIMNVKKEHLNNQFYVELTEYDKLRKLYENGEISETSLNVLVDAMVERLSNIPLKDKED